MKFIALAVTIAAAFILTACGKSEPPTDGTPILIPPSVSGSYKSADGKVTFNFAGDKVQITFKVGKAVEYKYSTEGNSLKWVYEATGVAESCEIKSSTALYCTTSGQAFTKIS